MDFFQWCFNTGSRSYHSISEEMGLCGAHSFANKRSELPAFIFQIRKQEYRREASGCHPRHVDRRRKVKINICFNFTLESKHGVVLSWFWITAWLNWSFILGLKLDKMLFCWLQLLTRKAWPFIKLNFCQSCSIMFIGDVLLSKSWSLLLES